MKLKTQVNDNACDRRLYGHVFALLKLEKTFGIGTHNAEAKKNCIYFLRKSQENFIFFQNIA